MPQAPTIGALPQTTLPAVEGTRHAESFRARRSAKDKPGPGGSLDAPAGQEPAPRPEATRIRGSRRTPPGLRRAPGRDSGLQIPPSRNLSLQAHLVKGTWGLWTPPRRSTLDTSAAKHAWALVGLSLCICLIGGRGRSSSLRRIVVPSNLLLDVPEEPTWTAPPHPHATFLPPG
ncbi:hypothetical protein NN561_015018 [Cricetulus griseus]